MNVVYAFLKTARNYAVSDTQPAWIRREGARCVLRRAYLEALRTEAPRPVLDFIARCYKETQ